MRVEMIKTWTQFPRFEPDTATAVVIAVTSLTNAPTLLQSPLCFIAPTTELLTKCDQSTSCPASSTPRKARS